MEGDEQRFLAESDARAEVKERPIYRTERGFVLPPGMIPWKEYERTQTRAMWYADHGLRKRIRGLAGSRERFIISDNPDDLLAFELVRAEFRAETNQIARGVREHLRAAGVRVVVNGPSEKRLHAWERELPRFTVKCFPMLFTSEIPKKWDERMTPSPRVAECLMHFDMERKLQRVRWHSNVDADVLARAKTIGLSVDGDRDEVNAAYARNDLVAVAAVVSRHISQAILRFP